MFCTCTRKRHVQKSVNRKGSCWGLLAWLTQWDPDLVVPRSPSNGHLPMIQLSFNWRAKQYIPRWKNHHDRWWIVHTIGYIYIHIHIPDTSRCIQRLHQPLLERGRKPPSWLWPKIRVLDTGSRRMKSLRMGQQVRTEIWLSWSETFSDPHCLGIWSYLTATLALVTKLCRTSVWLVFMGFFLESQRNVHQTMPST